jgi:mono/diheme cytochrome c family protein
MKDVSRCEGATAFCTYHRRYQNWTLRLPIERAIYSTHANMPPFNFTEAQVNAIVAYIDSLVPPR